LKFPIAKTVRDSLARLTQSLTSKPASDPTKLRLRDFPKFVRLRRESEKRRELARNPYMTYLFWESTLRCNLRCVHCGSSCEAQSPLEELSTEQICGILDDIAEDFDTRNIFVSITGGEPLLRRDLYEVVAHMTKLGMRCCIVTNGTLLGKPQAKRLYDAGMRTVTVSVDGLKKSHEAIRGKDTYERTLAGLTNAREAGFDWVEAITCVRPANLGELEQIEATVKAAGANLWRVITIDQMGRLAGPTAACSSELETWLEPAQINELLSFVAKRRKEIDEERDHFGVRFSCGGFLGVQNELSVRPEGGQCQAGLQIASILADGRVGACPSIPREINAQGSALERRFSDIWREEFRSFRDLDRPVGDIEGQCEGCSWFSMCLGGGFHERIVQPRQFCWLERQRSHQERG
jgi:radical SAM protein with 4Fe4S-binding SPASM domain